MPLIIPCKGSFVRGACAISERAIAIQAAMRIREAFKDLFGAVDVTSTEG
jgi:hypothetical protein